MLLSGGVDSTVCAALITKALGHERVIAIHIDNGFMRKNESEQVRDSLEKVNLQVKVVPASLEFLNGETTINDCAPPRKTPLLCHVSDPEDKRRIIGDTFMRVANEVIEDLNLNPDEVMLGQGTLRPDLIESASGLASGQVSYSKGPNCRVGPIKSVGGPIFGRTYMAIRIYLVIWPNSGPNKVM